MAAPNPSEDGAPDLHALRLRLLDALKATQDKRREFQQQYQHIVDLLQEDDSPREGPEEDDEPFWGRVAMYFRPIGPDQLALCQPEPEPSSPPPTPLDDRPSQDMPHADMFAHLDPAAIRTELTERPRRRDAVWTSEVADTETLYSRLLCSLVECVPGDDSDFTPTQVSEEIRLTRAAVPRGPYALLCLESAVLHELRAARCVAAAKVDMDLREDDDLSAQLRQCHQRLRAQVQRNNTRKALLVARMERYRRREAMRATVMRADRDLERAYKKRKRIRSPTQRAEHFRRAVAQHEAAMKEAQDQLGSEAEGELHQLWEQAPAPLFTSDD